ncbi:MAG: endo-1,4-beta-xylanase, partial [Candidatus Korobacteraceae bacterium]
LIPSSTFSMQPGTDPTPVLKDTKVSGSAHPTLLLRYQSRITYDVPGGQDSFRGILFKSNADIGPDSQGDLNRMRVRFLLDGKEAYDTVLDATMPPEQFALPLYAAKKLTIAVDQMLAGGALCIADATFSSRPVSQAITFHLLPPGTGYANLGSNVRQVAFRAYYPGESVPIQLEFSGLARAGTVILTFTSRQQLAPAVLTIPLRLEADGAGSSIGTTHWQVPVVLGPAQLELRVEVNGKSVYQRAVKIAIARKVDVSKDSPSSTFAIHLSSAGIPYLADSVADIWGANWARVFLRWEEVEFVRGQYDWRSIDELVNLYSAQNIQILGVLGETAPKWAVASGQETEAAFYRFVKAAVEHFRGKIRYWDVYNEVDSKYHGGVVMDKADPAADIRLLREETNTIRRAQPDARLVCCSTGTSYWLVYDKRLYDNGLLNAIDILSLHPYQSGPPEERDGLFNYPEMIGRLRDLEHTYGGNKPIWSTEANWLIGPEGEKGGLAPYVDEHSQSSYLVRVNLLSMALGVTYFAHSPFFTPFHREILLDSVASYANMAYNFGQTTGARLLTLPDGIYGVTANEGSRTISALWTTRESAQVKITGMSGVRFQDIYGNPVAYDASNIPLSGDPVYVIGNGTPSISVEQVASAPVPKPLPAPSTWTTSFFQKYSQTKTGVRITTRRTNYGTLLKSPAIDVAANSCYRVSMKIHTWSGGVAIVSEDVATAKRLGSTIDLFDVTGRDDYEPAMTIRTGSTTQVRVVLIADNPNAAEITDFEISHPQISPCAER